MISHQNVKGDHRGQLIAIESNKDIPFDIKRVFYIYGTENNVPRGQHANFRTKHYLICVNGSCRVTLDDGYKKTLTTLIGHALVYRKMSWFGENCTILPLIVY